MYLGGISGRTIPTKVYKIEDDYWCVPEESQENQLLLEKSLAFVIPEEIGTITKTILAIRKSKLQGKMVVLQSDKERDKDTFMADFAVGLNVPYVNFGNPLKVYQDKYRRLQDISELLV